MSNIIKNFKTCFNNIKLSLSNNIFLLKIVWDYNKLYFILYCIFTVIEGIYPLVGLYFPKMIIDAIQRGEGLYTLCYIVFLVFVISAIYGITTYTVRGKFLQIKSDMLYQHFRTMLNKKVAALDFEYLENPQIHDTFEKAKKICSGGATNIIHGIFNSISEVITIFSIIIIISQLNFIVVLLAILTVILDAIFNSKSKKLEVEVYDDLAPYRRKINYYMNLMGDSQYAKEIRLFHLTKWIEDRLYGFIRTSEGKIKPFYEKMHFNYLFSFIVSLLQDCIVFIIVGYQVINKFITFGDFVLYVNAIKRFSESLNGISWQIIQIKTTGEYVKYFREFLAIENKIQRDDVISPINIQKTRDFVIKFNNVSFSYPGSEKNLFENFNFEIESNKKYAIVGPNGAGKTTFIKLLTRLYDPKEGNITFNGIDIKDINYVDYRKMFSVVFQDYKTYAFSIKENVVLSDDKADDNSIVEILNDVGLGEKIGSLEKGIHTQLYKIFDSKGIELSGGEKQKLAIARAFYKNSPIIILDEPSSALDPYAEYELFKQFSNLVQNKTAIFISHRLSSVRFADYVIFIKDGSIVSWGPHEKLMSECKEYNELYNIQAKYYR